MRDAWRRMARVGTVVGLAALATVSAPRLAATGTMPGPDLSRVRVLAVAPFLNEDPPTRWLTAAAADRLAVLLRRAPFQVLGPGAVSAAMVSEGVTPADLISPSRSIALARRLGADAILTGRVVRLEQGRVGRLRVGEDGDDARAAIDFRVLDVATRLKLFEEEIGCAGVPLAREALDCVVRLLAARLLGPR